MVIDEFYQRACHVTLGSDVTNYNYSALLTRRIFPSLPPRMRTRKNTDGLRDYVVSMWRDDVNLQWLVAPFEWYGHSDVGGRS